MTTDLAVLPVNNVSNDNVNLQTTTTEPIELLVDIVSNESVKPHSDSNELPVEDVTNDTIILNNNVPENDIPLSNNYLPRDVNQPVKS